jgi:outer membrane lipoprotein-sorting protein
MIRNPRLTRLVFAGVLACLPALFLKAAHAQNADDILKKTRALYGGLSSYSDTGVVIVEYGSSSQDRHSFTTYFNRAPRHLLLDFKKQGGDQYVIWGDSDAFHTWWKTSGQVFDYPNPNNVPAISMSGLNTKNTALKIPTLLYSKAQMGGDFNNLADVELDGTEVIGNHRCYRLVGRTSDTYGATGKEVNIRKMTLWIDIDTMLIRQVREEAKAVAGQRNRTITTYQPQANPKLDDSRFKFNPPQPN